MLTIKYGACLLANIAQSQRVEVFFKTFAVCDILHALMFNLISNRAAPGIEPGTSGTRSENHTTNPSSQ